MKLCFDVLLSWILEHSLSWWDEGRHLGSVNQPQSLDDNFSTSKSFVPNLWLWFIDKKNHSIGYFSLGWKSKRFQPFFELKDFTFNLIGAWFVAQHSHEKYSKSLGN